jgi:hypothetical protein
MDETVISISSKDIDGMAREICKHDGFESEDLPMLRIAVSSWMERIVQDTVTYREFTMRHFGYAWVNCLEAAERSR